MSHRPYRFAIAHIKASPDMWIADAISLSLIASRICRLSPPPHCPLPMRYCDFVTAVGSALARSNDPDIFSLQWSLPPCEASISRIKWFFPFIRYKWLFLHISPLCPHNPSQRDQHSFFSHFWPPPSARKLQTVSLRPQHILHYAVLLYYAIFLLFDDILIGQHRNIPKACKSAVSSSFLPKQC